MLSAATILVTPINSDGIASAGQRTVTNHELFVMIDRVPIYPQWNGKNGFVEQVSPNRLQFCRHAPDSNRGNGSLKKNIQQKREPCDVIKMCVADQNIDGIGLNQRCKTVNAGARVQHDPVSC